MGLYSVFVASEYLADLGHIPWMCRNYLFFLYLPEVQDGGFEGFFLHGG